MALSVKIASSVYREAVHNMTGLSPEDRDNYLSAVPKDNTPVTVVLDSDNKQLLQELLKLHCAKSARTRITQYLAALELGRSVAVNSTSLKDDVTTFDTALHFLQGLKGLPFEVKLAGRWYLFRCPDVDLLKNGRKIVGLVIPVKFQMVRTTLKITKVVYREDFKAVHTGRTYQQLLKSLDVRPARSDNDPENDPARLVSTAIGLAEDFGKQVKFRGPVMEVRTDKSDNYYGAGMTWESWKQVYEPERGVVEPELELPEVRRNQYGVEVNTEDVSGTLPFVRIFSLRTRRFVYTDVRNVSSYEYDLSVGDRLVLPDRHRETLTKVFEAGTETIKDLVAGKTGGIVILAWGNPGVGKTLTAEVYAETKERPLYALSVSEIGTTPADIEKNLQKVFTRVERWNAVLLFDECDVFLTKRSNDLQQSAVVGMFLRLMEYYTGVLFLTTNRLTTIDEAVDSRITFRIHYKDLGPKDRRKIWRALLGEAAIATGQDVLDQLVKIKMDGRKIRNTVRALQLTGVTSLEDWQSVESVLEYIETPNAGERGTETD